MDGETPFYLGRAGGVDHQAERTARTPRRVVMKSGAIGAVTRHAASAAMMLSVAAAADGQVEFGRS